MKVNTIRERIYSLSNDQGVSIERFCIETGIAISVLNALESENLTFWTDIHPKIVARFPKISHEWLLFGVGSAFADDQVNPGQKTDLLSLIEISMYENRIVDVNADLNNSSAFHAIYHAFRGLLTEHESLLERYPEEATKAKEVQVIWINAVVSRMKEMLIRVSESPIQ